MRNVVFLGILCVLEPVAHAAAAPVPAGETCPASETCGRSLARSGDRSGGEMVLAVNWQPAFCETRPGTAECASMTEERFDASRFTLHGLWPQPPENIYCDVDPAIVAEDQRGRWGALPEPELAESTRAELALVMPGMQVGLHRHEWWKHGTCYGATAEEYFADSLAVMRALNDSPVRNLFAASVGSELTGEQIQAAFDDAFGARAGERVRVECVRDGARRLISGIDVELAGVIAESSQFGDLILAAAPTDPGCGSGLVDPVGMQ